MKKTALVLTLIAVLLTALLLGCSRQEEDNASVLPLMITLENPGREEGLMWQCEISNEDTLAFASGKLNPDGTANFMFTPLAEGSSYITFKLKDSQGEVRDIVLYKVLVDGNLFAYETLVEKEDTYKETDAEGDEVVTDKVTEKEEKKELTPNEAVEKVVDEYGSTDKDGNENVIEFERTDKKDGKKIHIIRISRVTENEKGEKVIRFDRMVAVDGEGNISETDAGGEHPDRPVTEK